MNVFLIKKRWHCIKIYFYSKQETNESVWAMKKKLNAILLSVVIGVLAMSAFGEDCEPCEEGTPGCGSNPGGDSMPVELGE